MLFRLRFLLLYTACGILFCSSQNACADNSEVAADWVVETANGRRIALSDEIARGHKVVTIFWATWCRNCRELLPKINALYKQLADQKVTFIALNIWEDNDPLEYMKRNHIDIPLAVRAETIARKYGVRGTPGVFVIGEGGRILYRRRPGNTSDDVMGQVKQSLRP